YRAFGLWVEQLVAESTGKLGTGVVPVLEDGGLPVTAYGEDRALVIMRDDTDTGEAEYARVAREAGVPVIDLIPPERAAIGAEFVRWTHAVALLGFLLGVNPFDEPDVAHAKAATTGVLSGDVAVPPATTDAEGIWLTPAGALAGDEVPADVTAALSALLDTLHERSYLGILAYLPELPELLGPLSESAAKIAQTCRVPVCVELGPRYLHSTGQLHKGGPETGSFLLITARGRSDRPVPGEPFSLAQLFRAQAEGDLVTLARRGRPVLRLDLPAEDPASVTRLVAAISRALSHR
ncbi:MAG TPA: transaldolase, partial [Coriobacteriia bacterium]|nr:transaldolase [Coriobacteriia bacterium]